MAGFKRRRKLPHIEMPGATYFVTWRLHQRQRELEPAERDRVVRTIRFFERSRYELVAHVVMNDHVHVMVTPSPAEPLADIVRSWKSYSARELKHDGRREGTVWSRDYFDRIMRDEAELREKVHYILQNPWARWPELGDYPWVGLGAVEGKLARELAIG